MGKLTEHLSPRQISFIEQQHLFFVATAAAEGTVNLSPKGMDSFRILNEKQVIWLNVTGSGNETAAHVQQNPRMTVMFCALRGAPDILRLYGQATAIHRADPAWQSYISLFPELPGTRQLFLLDIDQVQSSCGMSVPLFDYVGERDSLIAWAEKKGPAGVEAYWAQRNQISLDGFESHILEKSGTAAKFSSD
ncbi:pyridoxamine 5'-phosphate oxidase family protein [Photobacterium sp. TY1-4]|uniref:pyridoxamine 5'-phosphate oxidase family protein n=1 Tax=Photobacterium sp. TY1-4 TaxID=2899122 RepID=UPI0021C072E9|nr:pyridoxamine 5'-phosphate oxidase family protein [Photobacterium sp. TY1-4]UXI03312.1 pyridoxamine 5'-phosphate oxidase family protein [Photobacterium sp. TY1-4]